MFWFYITLAEAYLGNEKFKEAEEYYRLSLSHGDVELWARQTATIQSLSLLELNYKDDKAKLELK